MASYTILCFQVTALFGLVYAWFYNGVPGVWQRISASEEAERLLSRLQLKASATTGGNGPIENPKEFATVAAVSHTAVLLLGFALSGLVLDVARNLGGGDPHRSLLAKFVRLPAVRWTVFAVAVATAFALLHAFFRWSFENRVGVTYRMAAQFFYERDGSAPFALMSTTSYVTFFAAGIAVKQLCPASVGGVDGIFPAVLMRWMPRLVKSFLAAMVLFHFAVMPIYDTVIKPVIKKPGGGSEAGFEGVADGDWAAEGQEFTHHFALLASLSHTAALALGVLLCWLARRSVTYLGAALLRPSRRQVLSVAMAMTGCWGTALCARRYAGVSLDTVWLMEQVTRDWCCGQLQGVLDAHALYTTRIADTLGLSSLASLEAAHPVVCLSFAVWFGVGLVTEYASATLVHVVESRDGRAGGGARPVFVLGPLRIYPVSKATCDAVGWLLPLGFTLVGLAHQHTVLFYDSLIRAFAVLLATVLPAAMLVQALSQRFGRKIQHEKSAAPLFWEEGCETVGALFMMACFAAWPLTRHRSGQRTALNWSLAETGDSLLFYTVVKLLGGILIADCWNYWKHRALHWRMLYAFHKNHHSFYDPSCFASFAIHPFEALLTFWQIMLFAIPDLKLWGPLHIGTLALLAVMNLYLHCGYAVDWLERSLPWLLLNTSRFHNVHHEITRAHFGEILFLWDWLCGTAIDRRLDDHPVIADMFAKAPYTAERVAMRRRMDAIRQRGITTTTTTMATSPPPAPEPVQGEANTTKSQPSPPPQQQQPSPSSPGSGSKAREKVKSQ